MKKQIALEREGVRFYGRTQVKNGEECLYHVGAAIEVGFTGKTLSAELTTGKTQYVCVFVDGEEEYVRTEITPEKRQYILAADLPEGKHTAKIVKSTEMLADGFVYELKIGALEADGFYPLSEPTGLKIEFIGDSITSGYGTLGNTGDLHTIENSDGCTSYAYYTAARLGAVHSAVSVSGICVKAFLWHENANMLSVYPYFAQGEREYPFDFQPDAVVINLGTNDAGYIEGRDPSYGERFSEDCFELLRYVRKKNPNAAIVWAYGMMGNNPVVSAGIEKAVEKMHDQKVSCIFDFAPNQLGAGGHPSKNAGIEWSETLAKKIAELI